MEVLLPNGTEQSSRGSDDPGFYSDSCSSALEHSKTKEMIYLDALSWRGMVIKRKDTELKILRAQDGDIITDADIKYHKLDSGWMLALPRPQVPRGSIAGNKSAARAVPTGTAHAGLEREANPRPLRAARQGPRGGFGGGDAAAGSAAAQGSPQQQKSMAGGQQDHSRQGYAERKARKDQYNSGGGKSGAAALAGGTGAVKATRNNAAAGGQRGTGGVHSSYAAAAKKSVKSKRVGGGGGDSGDSRKSEIGSMHSVATQGAAAECESKSASANNTHAAAAKTSVQSDHLVESKIKLCGVRRSSDGPSNHTTASNSRVADSEITETVAISPSGEAAKKSEESEHVAGSGGDFRESNAGDTPSIATQGAATGCQDSATAANSTSTAAAKRTVKSKHAGGSGGDSRKSHHSKIGTMSSIAAQSAAAECQILATTANSSSAAAAQESGEGGWRVDRKRNSRARPAANRNVFDVLESVREQPALEAATAEVAARDAEIERLQRVVADVREEAAARLAVVREEATAEANRFSTVNRDLQRRLRDEKKITDGVLSARQIGTVAAVAETAGST